MINIFDKQCKDLERWLMEKGYKEKNHKEENIKRPTTSKLDCKATSVISVLYRV